ncbi:MAG: VWA domain-containing protein [Cyclobacteriaceae bacterium]|nr:VWA domain-containing protein [Cyclobacteriaceae bacterium]
MEETYAFEQTPFGTGSFADNPEPRCPCILLLDVSGSMAGSKIQQLNEGISVYKDELLADSLASKRVETAVITFGPVKIESVFQTAPSLYLPNFEASGDTPMGSAIKLALELLSQRKAEYRSNGIQFYRPWIFLITDGAPTDNWQEAAAMIKEGENGKSFAFFAVGVEDANLDILKQISVREPLKLRGLKFRELFMWLSNSMKSVSRSVMGSNVKLLPPGWAEI